MLSPEPFIPPEEEEVVEQQQPLEVDCLLEKKSEEGGKICEGGGGTKPPSTQQLQKQQQRQGQQQQQPEQGACEGCASVRFRTAVLLVLLPLLLLLLLFLDHHRHHPPAVIIPPDRPPPPLQYYRSFLAARMLTKEKMQALEQEFGPEDSALLFSSMHFYNRSYLKAKLVRALLGDNASEGKYNSAHDFVFSFQGTSVTAGHDSFVNQSFPMVFESVIKEAFTMAGLNLVVRNQGIGNNPPIPAAFIAKAQLGLDADVAVWEWGMNLVGSPQQRRAFVEMWIRNAILNMPKRPALLFLDPGGGVRKPVKEEDSEILIQPLPREGPPPKWVLAGGGQEDENLLLHYQAFAPHTQAMAEALWSLDHLEKYNFETLFRKDKPSPLKKPWHPGPWGHRLRGQILGYHYLGLLHDALEEVSTAIQTDNVQELLRSAGQEQEKALTIPPPLFCEAEWCELSASAVTSFLPRVEDDSSPSSSSLSSLAQAVQLPQGLIPVPPSLEGAANDQWHVQLFQAEYEPVTRNHDAGLDYLDAKYVIQGASGAGPLLLEIETQTNHRMLFCQPPCDGLKRPEGFTDLNNGTEIRIDGRVMLLENEHGFYESHLVKTRICWATVEEIKTGKHSIELKVLPAAERNEGGLEIETDNRFVALSSIVWW